METSNTRQAALDGFANNPALIDIDIESSSVIPNNTPLSNSYERPKKETSDDIDVERLFAIDDNSIHPPPPTAPPQARASSSSRASVFDQFHEYNTQQQHAEAQQQIQQQQIEQLTSIVRQQSLTIDKMQANAGERNSSGISSTSNDNCCCVLLFNNSWCVSLRRVFNQFNDPTNTPNALEDKSGKFLGIWEPAQNFGIKYCWCCGPRVGCVSNFSHINIFQSHSNCFKVFSPKHFTNIIIPHLHLIFQK